LVAFFVFVFWCACLPPTPKQKFRKIKPQTSISMTQRKEEKKIKEKKATRKFCGEQTNCWTASRSCQLHIFFLFVCLLFPCNSVLAVFPFFLTVFFCVCVFDGGDVFDLFLMFYIMWVCVLLCAPRKTFFCGLRTEPSTTTPSVYKKKNAQHRVIFARGI